MKKLFKFIGIGLLAVILLAMIFGESNEDAKSNVASEQERTETTAESEEPESEPTPTSGPDVAKTYPRFTEETMDRNFIFSCEGGDEVVLWEKPAGIEEGQKSRVRVPCGTRGWAFNEYHNEEYGVTFYAVQMFDIDKAYGWVTEDLLSWR